MSQYELKMIFNSADALYAAVAKLAGETAPAPARIPTIDVANVAPAAEVEAPLPPKTRAPRQKKEEAPAPAPVVAETAAIEAIAEVSESAEAVAKAYRMPTGDEVKSAAEAVNAKVGIVGLKKLLAKYTASRISEIAPENRAAFIADCQQVA